jgi:hypothetical protein
MNRAERYKQVMDRLKGMREHAKNEGDGVQADKCRKLLLDVSRLALSDETEMNKECD